MSKKRKPLIFVISSPSGGGKTTIIQDALAGLAGIERSVSCTTRKPRTGEKNKVDYIFLKKKEFEARRKNGEFLEWAGIFGNKYGTLKSTVEEILDRGKDAILCIDVKGAGNIRKKMPGGIGIFIMPPTFDDLKKRLKKRRTESKKALEARLSEAKREMREAGKYDYVVINDDLAKATREVVEIIKKERRQDG